MVLTDAWKIFVDAFREQRALDRKRKAFEKFTRNTLNYPLIEEIVRASARQNPGFYSRLIFPDGTRWEFGVMDKRGPRDPEAQAF